ncbi:hypothetical protein [uncultured Tateyamaria sp.]|uniref:hypothetical protein n=1 Tax=uncultured Tateyamaria sp. TaxID=455651 RepID=UPI002636AEE6|nr:hypothetical protein [uncultured Tateyamaria sp.]
MRSTASDLHDTLRDVFSLAPTEESRALQSDLIAQFGRDDSAISERIIWAEFQLDGAFLRAGISNARSMETVSVLEPGSHPEITEMNDIATGQRLQAGMVIAARAKDGFHWCVPFTTVSDTGAKRNTLRTVLVTRDLFDEVFDLFNRQNQLTPSERLVVFQLVGGLSPMQAAQKDDVSIETKRSHLKRAMSKLGCNTQAETVRTLVSQLIHLMYLCEQDPHQSRVIDSFTARHLRTPIRLSSQRLATGRLMRVWDMGPLDGKPLLVLHGYLFPFLLLNAQDALDRYYIRLIVPVRGGYLDDQACASAFNDGALVDQTVDDLLSFAKATWSGPVDVLCQATGAFFAMRMSQKDPDLLSRAVVTSVNLMNKRREPATPSAKFLEGLRKLGKHNGMYKKLSTQFQRRVFSNARTTRFVLRKLFSSCASDLDALTGKVGAGAAFDWYRDLHAHSTLGIASDFDLVQGQSDQLASGFQVRTTFLHGADDHFTTAAVLRDHLADHAQTDLRVIKGAGQLGIASHADAFWDAIAEVLELTSKA